MATMWPKPRVYPTKASILRAHQAEFYFIRPMEPAGSMLGVKTADGSYNWYDYDQHRGGWVLRATTLRTGPAQIFPAQTAEESESVELSGLGQNALPSDTATTSSPDQVPTVQVPTGYAWFPVGPTSDGKYQWQVRAETAGDVSVGMVKKFPWALGIGVALVALVFGALRTKS